MKKLLAVLTAAALTLGVTASAASAHPTPEPDCEGETYAVVSAPGDAAMAELIASWQVLDTPCIVAPADAKASVSESQQTVVLGGTAAVPESAVDGLNVIVRLAGADRVATAEAVLAWIDNRQQGDLAAVARVDATSSDGEFVSATFTVGKDIQAGLWRFSKNSGYLGTEGDPLQGYLGAHCRYNSAGTTHSAIIAIETASGGNGFKHPWGHTGLAVSEPFRTIVFVLKDDAKVTLRANKETCEIERHTF